MCKASTSRLSAGTRSFQDAVIRNFEIIGEAANKIQALDRRRRDLKTGAGPYLEFTLDNRFYR
jgi:hypothetical protein